MPTSEELQRIIEATVLRVFDIKLSAIQSKSQVRDIVVPRQCYMALMRDFTNKPDIDIQPIELGRLGFELFHETIDGIKTYDKGMSLGKIGAIFNKNHATVINAHHIIREQWWIDRYFGFGDKVRMAYAQVAKIILMTYKSKEVSDEV